MKKPLMLFCLFMGLSFLYVGILPMITRAGEDLTQLAVKRQKMVAIQLRGRDIVDDRVLSSMQKVPRHLFVPPRLQPLAYEDTPLPIGQGQTISQPYIVALMSQVLKVKPDMRVLEVGTGSGYQAAVLAEMGAEVFTIEIIPELGLGAEQVIEKLGYERIQVKIGDGYKGWPEHAPFDRIIVTCAPSQIPGPLKTQLAEGGRMVIPVGRTGFQELVLLTKKNDRIVKDKIIGVRFVPMVDEKGKTY